MSKQTYIDYIYTGCMCSMCSGQASNACNGKIQNWKCVSYTDLFHNPVAF